ncbi:MAG: DUF2071 domain-containing protein [Chloroflexi bacterium]|nr:DUF2071 domain-containing protein [Chloroflexota bacterium]
MKIFISYRRDDSAGWAGRVYDRISNEFGPENCFMDVEGLQAGENFDTAILEQASAADVALVMIGPNWFVPDAATGLRRIDKPGDWVRREIETALASGSTVIPLLVQGARSPRSNDLPETLHDLGRKETFALDMKGFRDDLDRLMPRIQSLDPWRPFKPPARAPIADHIWQDSLHLHWPVDPDGLLSWLPEGFALDTYEGKAWITADCVRSSSVWFSKLPKLLPPVRLAGKAGSRIPGVGDFANQPIVNWKTYVSYRGRQGYLPLYMSLPTVASWLVWKATSPSMPFHHRPIRFTRTGEERSLSMAPGGPGIRAKYRPVGDSFIARRDSIEEFLYHRFLVYSGAGASGSAGQMEMQFAPWSLKEVELLELKESFLKRFELKSLGPPVAHQSTRITATSWPPQPVDKGNR